RVDCFDHAVSAIESPVQFDRRNSNRGFWISVRDGVIPSDRRDWFVIKSYFRHDGGDVIAHLPDLFGDWMDRSELLHHRALDWRHCLYRFIERRHHFAGSENRISGRIDTEVPAGGHPRGRVRLGSDSRSDPSGFE